MTTINEKKTITLVNIPFNRQDQSNIIKNLKKKQKFSIFDPPLKYFTPKFANISKYLKWNKE